LPALLTLKESQNNKDFARAGLIALAAARASGAHPIVITDIEPARLAFAKVFVPSCQTYLMDRKLNARENANGIRRLFGAAHDIENEPNPNESFAPETVLECTGVESSICAAAYVARRGGRIVGIGVGKSVMNNLPFMHLSLAEV
jgi:L-iditol 2-dehydrogenase